MPIGKMIGGIAAMLIVVGLLHGALSASQISAENVADHEDPADYVWNSWDVTDIMLDGNAIAVDGGGATVDGSKVTITCGGTYSFHGALTDGQIIVDSINKKTVRLILDGADIRCSWSAPIIVENAEKTILILAGDTENYVVDGRSGVVENSEAGEPNAAIFSKDDLTLWGGGSLTVCGHVKDGISSKDGLIVAGGVLDINAVDDGIRGKDYLVVRGGNVAVKAGGDGLKSDNDADSGMGYVSIEAGTINVTSGADAIQAETDVLIFDGQVTLRAGGGSNGRTVTNLSAKGIKAGVSVIVGGGSVAVDSGDDAIHSNGSLAIYGGTLALSTIDDAIHADASVDVNHGDIQITRCYEGIDSNIITIEGGDIQIVSSDDGIVAGESLFIGSGVIKVTSGADAISAETDLTIVEGQFTLTSGGGSGKIATATSAKGIKGTGGVVIDGGDFTVDSADDAVHSNGDIMINGGTFAISAGDDGINVSAGGDMMGMPGGGAWPGGTPGGTPGGGGIAPREVPTAPGTAGNYWLYINGGYLYIDALGDGIDSNGSIAMTDGVVIVNGPTANDNGALDHSSFPMTGGFLVAAGSSGMAQTTSTTSTQCSILLTFNTTLAARTLVHIQSSSGEDILTFVPTKQYSSVAFSSPKLIRGSTYDVYYGGSCTGVVSDGLYQGGTYTPGTKYTSFTISSTVTNVR
jgi:hypothetical protein